MSTYIIKKIGIREIETFEGESNPELATEGWAVVRLEEDNEKIIDWYADKWPAEQHIRDHYQ